MHETAEPVYEVMLQKDWITQLAENEPDDIENQNFE